MAYISYDPFYLKLSPSTNVSVSDIIIRENAEISPGASSEKRGPHFTSVLVAFDRPSPLPPLDDVSSLDAWREERQAITDAASVTPPQQLLATFLRHPGIHSPEEFNFSSEVSCAGPTAAPGQLSARLVVHIWFKRAKLSSFPLARWHCKKTSVSSTFLLLPTEPCLPVVFSH
ncbi:unnamed protein product [Rangifer tarandus platyrhynchus]|uniref:Uncharacterized protein n=1 Tax=Rangifer tarandus platyrhynchus TaxID=3082113 RepID=A0AC59ZLB8_RANTA